MIDIQFDDKILTKNLKLWKEKNIIPGAGQYNKYSMPQFVLDFEGLHKIVRLVDGYMLGPAWSNKTFKIEAKSFAVHKFEDIIDTLTKLRSEDKMIFLNSFFFCPDYPVHVVLDPETFEAKVMDEVKITNNAHWKIRYGVLEVIQPPEPELTLEQRIAKLQAEGVI